MNTNQVNVLLVEDNEIDREVVRRAFRRYQVETSIHDAMDGVEALAILRGDAEHPPLPRPYLILLDLNMPRMDGIEFLEEVRADRGLRDSIVFVLTTSSSDEDKVAAYDQNVAGYIIKGDIGIDFGKLVKLLDYYWHTVELPPRHS